MAQYQYLIWGADIISDVELPLNNPGIISHLLWAKTEVDLLDFVTVLFVIKDGKLKAFPDPDFYLQFNEKMEERKRTHRFYYESDFNLSRILIEEHPLISKDEVLDVKEVGWRDNCKFLLSKSFEKLQEVLPHYSYLILNIGDFNNLVRDNDLGAFVHHGMIFNRVFDRESMARGHYADIDGKPIYVSQDPDANFAEFRFTKEPHDVSEYESMLLGSSSVEETTNSANIIEALKNKVKNINSQLNENAKREDDMDVAEKILTGIMTQINDTIMCFSSPERPSARKVSDIAAQFNEMLKNYETDNTPVSSAAVFPNKEAEDNSNNINPKSVHSGWFPKIIVEHQSPTKVYARGIYTDKNGTWCRVSIPPFDTLEDAISWFENKLNTDGIEYGKVKTVPLLKQSMLLTANMRIVG